MASRKNEGDDGPRPTKKRNPRDDFNSSEDDDDEEDLEYEDPFVDEEEEEDIIEHMDDDDEDGEGKPAAVHEEDEDENELAHKLKTYLPGMELEQDEELQCSNSAYIMLHRMLWEWPCLSFDFLPDTLGHERTKFPLTLYCVAGTQASKSSENNITLMKITSLHKTQHDDEEDDDGGVSLEDNDNEEDNDDDDECDDSPIMSTASIKHMGCVNRIRCCPHGGGALIAAWSEAGQVSIFDMQEELQKLDAGQSIAGNKKKPALFYNSAGSGVEGYALDWSPVTEYRLLTGNEKAEITVWDRTDGRSWKVSSPYSGHTGSVEDLQWSPVEPQVFASCSADKTVRVWDARVAERCAITVNAADTDVNVISWNRTVSYLLASGSDDGGFRIWDLRNLSRNTSIGQFNWHKKPITSIAWHPSKDSVVAVSGADDQLTLWDLSLERDEEEEREMRSQGIDIPDVPAQLIFVHQGQSDIKELRWHPQIPGVIGSTAADGFNLFKTINSE